MKGSLHNSALSKIFFSFSDLSYFGSWLILVNAMMGASIVALPYVVKISGGVIQYFILLSFAVLGNIVTMTVYGK